MDFCTVTDIENFLQLTIHTDPVKNASALRAIKEATEAIKNWCHQVIERVTNEVITLDCKGGYRIFLPELPVISVTAVTENSVGLTATTDYKLAQYGVLYRVDDDWAVGVQNIVVVYTHGYAVLPDDLVGVCTRAAARAFQAGLRAAETAGVPGVQSLSLGDYSVSYGAAGDTTAEGVMGASAARMLLLSEKDALARYRYIAQ